MKKIAVALVAPIIALSATSVASAAPIGGQKCNTPGAAQRANNGKFVCSPEGGTSTWRRVDGTGTIVDVAGALRGYSIFATALRASGLEADLAATGPYTVFAPRNAAFLSLGSGLLDALLRPDNADNLKRILRYHVVRGRIPAADLVTGDYVTLDGTQLRVVVRSNVRANVRSNIRVDGGRVTMADVRATNGVMHGVSDVFIPAGVTIKP